MHEETLYVGTELHGILSKDLNDPTSSLDVYVPGVWYINGLEISNGKLLYSDYGLNTVFSVEIGQETIEQSIVVTNLNGPREIQKIGADLLVVELNDDEISKVTIDIVSSNEDVNESKISIFPNPVTDELFIENLPNNTTYDLITMHGQVIMSSTSNDNANIRLNLSQVSKGCYLLRIRNGDYVIMSSRIIKQ